MKRALQATGSAWLLRTGFALVLSWGCLPAKATLQLSCVHPLPSVNQPVSISNNCLETFVVGTLIAPNLPPLANIYEVRISGLVDDALVVAGGGALHTYIGFNDCTPTSFNGVDVTAHANETGFLSFQIYDKTYPASNNAVSLSGTCAYFFTMQEAEVPDITDRSTEDEGWEEGHLDPGDGTGVIPELPRPDRQETFHPPSWDLWNVNERVSGCECCGIRGHPQIWVDEASMNIKVLDVPVWQETPVGYPLELRMRFSNFAESRGGGVPQPFGQSWSCQWQSHLAVETTNSNRIWMWMPSGSVVLFTNTVSNPNGFYPPSSVDGWLEKVDSTLYKYRKSDDQTWRYTYASWAGSQVYLLTEMKDAWENKLTVSYLSNRLYRVEQTAPASERRLEFSYGTNGLASAVSAVGRTEAVRSATFDYWNSLLTGVADMAGNTYGYSYMDGQYITTVADAAISYTASPTWWNKTNGFELAISRPDGAGGTDRTSYKWNYWYPGFNDATHIVKTVARGGDSHEEQLNLANYMFSPSGRKWVVTSRGEIGRNNVTNYYEGYSLNATNGLMASRIDYNDNIWRYEYNGAGRLTKKEELASGDDWIYVYHGTGPDLAYVQMPDGSIPRRFTYLSARHAVSSVSNATGQVTAYQYNSRGQITNVWDGRMGLSFLYDTNGFLLEKRRDGVLLEEYAYDDFGNFVWMRDAAGLETALTRDGLNRVVRREINVAAPGQTEEWMYGCCFLESHADRLGNTWGYVYNSKGELLENRNNGQAGDWYRQAFNVFGKPTSIENDDQSSLRQYNAFGHLTNVEGVVFAADRLPEGRYWPNHMGWPTQYTTRAGASWQMRYDYQGNRTSLQVLPASGDVGGQTQIILAESNRFNGDGRLVWFRNIDGLAVTNRYNAMGWLTNQVHPDGTSLLWTYTKWGEVATHVDREGQRITNRYDAYGRLVEQKDARSNSTFYAYDQADRFVAVTNALDQAWHFQYDLEGNVAVIQFPDSSTDTFAYMAGQLTEWVQNAGASGAVTNRYEHDIAGRLREVRRGGERVQALTYNALDLPETWINAEGVAVAHTWDDRGRQVGRAWSDSSSESWQYDWLGTTNHNDRFGIPTRIQPDRLGRLLRQTDGNTNVLRRTYATNSLWRLAEIQDARSNRTSWAYDRYGNPTNKTYANTSFESIQYNRRNQAVRRVSPGGIVTSNAYDANGNLAAVWRGQEPAATFAYDPLNQCTQMVDAVGTTRWTYDARGRVTGEANPWGAATPELRYDGAGRMTQLVFGAWSLALAHDALGRVSMLAAPEGTYSFGYYSNGMRRAGQSGPNGVCETRQYGNGLTNLVISNSAVRLLRLAYGRGAAERLTSHKHYPGASASAVRLRAMAYDRAGQWTNTAAAPATRIESRSYDPAGNPLGQTRLGISRQAAYNNLNQITNLSYSGQAATVLGGVRGGATNLSRSVTVNGQATTLSGCEYVLTNLAISAGTTNPVEVIYNAFYTNNVPLTASAFSTLDLRAAAFAHDADGNLTSDGLRTYQYDAAGRLTNVVEIAGGARLLSLRYDGLGRRVEAWRQDGQVERYVYVPGTFLVLAVLDGTNGVKEILTRGPDLSGTLDGAGGIGGLLSTTSGTETRYLHSDGLGNVILATDADGNSVAEYEYTPFGEELSRSGTYDSRFRFSSKERDPETGFYDFGYRVYAPALGRWLSRDPLGEFADPLHNLYRFVGNNPLNAVDPDGLATYQIQQAVLAGTSIRMPTGVTPYMAADTWYEQPAAQTYNLASFAVNFSAGAIREAFNNPEALGFAMMAVAAEAKFAAQGANWMRGGISKCANSQVLGDTALKGVSDDMLVHFSQTGNRASIASSGVTTKGASYFYRVGDVKNLAAAQVRGAIGPLARGGVDNSLAVIVSPEVASFTRIQMVLPEFVTMQNSVPWTLIRQVSGGVP